MDESKIEKKKQKLIDQSLMDELGVDKDALKKLKKKLAKVESRPERGIETWFRLASKNLYTRLQIIDAKANILITANAIIISVVLGTLYPRLELEPHLIFGAGVLVLTNVASISFAILAAIPKSWKEKTAVTNLCSADLMAFEEFSSMKLVDYRNSVFQTIEDGGILYQGMITDIHSLGVKLAKKYKLIRMSFLIFLYGIILSIITFAACFAM